MFKGEALKEIFVFKDIHLTKESFISNIDVVDKEANLSNSLEFKISIGVQEENFNVVAYKINTIFKQEVEDASIGDKLDKGIVSKLDVEYVSLFEISNDNYAKIFRELLNDDTDESREKIGNILEYVIDSVYPYIRVHIEYIYKKADILIEIPLKL